MHRYIQDNGDITKLLEVYRQSGAEATKRAWRKHGETLEYPEGEGRCAAHPLQNCLYQSMLK
jgi:hypothetical protein